jgi:hypothetical protein
LIRRGLPRSFS